MLILEAAMWTPEDQHWLGTMAPVRR
jgi:hypothetical protein